MNSDPLLRRVTDDKSHRFMEAFELLRQLDREVPGQLLSSFFYIASHNPCHKLAMEQDLNFSSASSSRCCDWLSDLHRDGKPGLGLIIKYDDPHNRRRVMCKLSPKGEAMIQAIKDKLYGQN